MKKVETIESMAHLSAAELRPLCHHILSVKRLARLCSPLECWIEVEKPIQREEVLSCIERGEEALMETPLWTSIAFGLTKITASENRERHIQKVAWFVKNQANDPISIDVGCESLGFSQAHLITDGNHRLAAAVIRGDTTIAVHVGGGLEDAKRMKLWNPNVYEKEDLRRFDERQAQAKEASKLASKKENASPGFTPARRLGR